MSVDALLGVLAVSDFWGGDGKTWLAIVAIVVLTVISLAALVQARTFVKDI
jgi:hypothetical protein